MATDSTEPLDDVDAASVTPGDVDESEVRAALDSRKPLVRQRGLEVCERLAEADVDAVRPLLDAVAPVAGDDNAANAQRAIGVLDAVADSDPAALDGRLDDPVGALDSDIVDVQLTGATLLGKLVVDEPDLVAPHVREVVEAIGATEPDPAPSDVGEFVDDPVTRQTIMDHEEAERRRRTSGRRTLVNVAVAVAEQRPDAAVDAVEEFTTLLDDVDPGVAGGAVDALGELAAADPDAVAPVRDDLLAALDHDRTVVRARTIRALGHLGDDAAVPKLRELAEADPDEDVRTLAAETADFLGGAG